MSDANGHPDLCLYFDFFLQVYVPTVFENYVADITVPFNGSQKEVSRMRVVVYMCALHENTCLGEGFLFCASLFSPIVPLFVVFVHIYMYVYACDV